MFARKDPKFPVLYRCEAVMGMFIFDPNGDTHVCLEAVGNRNLRVGVYDPEWRLDDEAFSKWTRRNVLSMQECRACKVRFVCAGGCTIESFNHGGEPCCMPFLREMDIAWEYFAKTQPELFA
jgi:radical SAM protein with 4Fe4S-binding SPASM domain